MIINKKIIVVQVLATIVFCCVFGFGFFFGFISGGSMSVPENVTIDMGPNYVDTVKLLDNMTNKVRNYSCSTQNLTYDCPDCICNCQESECVPELRTVVIDDCSKKLNLCNIRLDTLNDQLYDCMISNNSRHAENLSIELQSCTKERNELEDKLEDIKESIS